MSNNNWNKLNSINIRTAASRLNIKPNVINYYIDNGYIESKDGKIKISDFEIIKNQRNLYIGIKEYLFQHDGERFKARYVKNRNKYIDFLEENDYFGIEIIEPGSMLFAIPDEEEFYISKEDSMILDYKSEKFFSDFGLTEEEKVSCLIKFSKRNDNTIMYIKKYCKYYNEENKLFTPSFTAFVNILLSATTDVKQIKDQEVVALVEKANTIATKELLISFLKFVSKYENVKFNSIVFKKKEIVSITAYAYEEYVKLAKILFNNRYDKDNDLTVKSLENHMYAEMWLFISIHYVCGWRASDICNNWIYPRLKSDYNAFNIKVKTLKEDLLNDNISNETYEKIASYIINKIEMSFNVPSKTSVANVGQLRISIVPELRVFFGKLALIAEFHYISSNEGYMKANRYTRYCNWVNCCAFFGEEFYNIFGKNNISSRRLNKSYLQGIEEVTKNNGSTTLVAHIIASFARNHNNIDTTAIYLKDHGLTGETAEVVLYMMMQRGVLGYSLYASLMLAYPEEFAKLTAREQTEIMEMIPLSAYEIETTGTVLIASEKMSSSLKQGKVEDSIQILNAMYKIGQGEGKSKDLGVYCKKKALGEICEFPAYESCIANLCPYHVFTRDGVPTLIKVIKSYMDKYRETGNLKYNEVLNKKIIPAFHEVLNTVIEKMSKQEKTQIKLLIKEKLGGH